MRLIDAKHLLELVRKNAPFIYHILLPIVAITPTIEAEPVRHGRWDSRYDEHDGFYHHFCTECKDLAVFAYDEQDDYDEGMDGEWYLLGKNIVGIKENLTNYCPSCGAKMDGDSR